jgi:hypothetical protein
LEVGLNSPDDGSDFYNRIRRIVEVWETEAEIDAEIEAENYGV